MVRLSCLAVVRPPFLPFSQEKIIMVRAWSFTQKKLTMIMMEKGRKRNRPGVAGEGGKPTNTSKKQQRKALSKTPYFSPKPASTIAGIDIPLEQLMPQRRIELIADLSESILEDPSTALTSSRTAVSTSVKSNEKYQATDPTEKQYHKTQSKMNKLFELASLSTNGHDAHAARLALLSLLAIFQDILPSYRIRLPTEAESNVRVSKEVKQTMDYERKLLQAYQRYLQLLEKTWEDGKFGHRGLISGAENHTGCPTTLAATSIIALSQLLQTSYNFNFRSNLIQIVVRQANNHSSDEVRHACCHALSVLFTEDIQGDASLEAVRRIAKMVKDRQHHQGGRGIYPDVLNTWLSLPLRVHEDEAMAAKIASQVKKRRAKKSQQDKDTADIENELKEGEATVDKLELAKNQADTLHVITLTYFRILKVHGDTDKQEGSSVVDSTLLPCALRGLAKFSHLIHLDAIVDLLEVLKNLLKNGDQLSTVTCVHCILCALKTLRGPGRDVIPVDAKQYLIPLYGLLPRIGLPTIESSNSSIRVNVQFDEEGKIIEQVIQCLDHAFLQRRELSSTRLAGFLKRLACASLHCLPTSSVPLLACTRQIASRYSSSTSTKIGRMFENEEEIAAEGVFSPDAEDPEHSNSHATSFWELSLLRYHIHPKVSEHSSNMAEEKLLKLPAEAPANLCLQMKRDAQECYIEQKTIMKTHPLDTAAASRKKKSRRRQNQVRFITPRKTANWHLQMK